MGFHSHRRDDGGDSVRGRALDLPFYRRVTLRRSAIGRLMLTLVVASLLYAGSRDGVSANQSVTLTLPTTLLVHGGLYDTALTTLTAIGPNGATDKTFQVSDGAPFKTGMIIQVDNEL